MEVDIPKVVFRIASKRADEIWIQIKRIEAIHSEYVDSISSNDELKQLQKEHNEIMTFLKFYQDTEYVQND